MRIRTGLIVGLFIVAVLAVAANAADERGLRQVKVYLDRPDEGLIIRNLGFDVNYMDDDFATLVTNEDGIKQLRESGLQVEVIPPPAVDGKPVPFGGFNTLSQINSYVDDMIVAHSSIMTDKLVIGQSCEGRDLWAVKISDNPDIDEDEPELFFNSLIHANEPLTAEALLHTMDYLTDNYGIDPEVTDIVDNREIWFVLVINPDGYYYNELTHANGGGLWRKNRRDNGDGTYGVDLNRNFGYMWGYDDIGSSPVTSDGHYRGPAAFSEPETQAIRDFILSRDFVITADYHSAGHCYIWPWGYQDLVTPDENVYQVVVDSMSSYNNFQLYSHGVANGMQVDWSYGEQTDKPKILALLPEVGDGNLWTDPELIEEQAAENLQPNLFLCRVADSVYFLAPPRRPELQVPAGVQDSEYTISWTHEDTINTAVAFELVEYQDPVKVEDPGETLDDWTVNWFNISDLDYHSEPTSFRTWVVDNNSMLTTEPVYIGESESLRFWINYDMVEGYDYFYVTVATDGVLFEAIPGNITTTDDPHGYNSGNGVTGISGGWVEGVFDLSSYAGENLWLRLVSNKNSSSGELDPLYLDDILFVKHYSTETVIASDLTDIWYDFTGKPDGEYYYRVRAKDAQNQWGPSSKFGTVTVGGGAGCCEIMGDYNHDGQFDILDIDDFIDWLLREATGGQPPVCVDEADVSSVDEGVPDGSTDILDIDYMIGYLLREAYSVLPDCP